MISTPTKRHPPLVQRYYAYPVIKKSHSDLTNVHRKYRAKLYHNFGIEGSAASSLSGQGLTVERSGSNTPLPTSSHPPILPVSLLRLALLALHFRIARYSAKLDIEVYARLVFPSGS